MLVSVSSCRCCMFVSCVHPVAVLNAAFCILSPSPDSYQVYCDTCDPFSCQAATLGIILKHHMFMSNGVKQGGVISLFVFVYTLILCY